MSIFFSVLNTIADDELTTHQASSSPVMIVKLFARNIPVWAPEVLSPCMNKRDSCFYFLSKVNVIVSTHCFRMHKVNAPALPVPKNPSILIPQSPNPVETVPGSASQMTCSIGWNSHQLILCVWMKRMSTNLSLWLVLVKATSMNQEMPLLQYNFTFREWKFIIMTLVWMKNIKSRYDVYPKLNILYLNAYGQDSEIRMGDEMLTENHGSKCLLCIDSVPGLILGLRPANERRRYKGTPSLIGGRKPRISPEYHWSTHFSQVYFPAPKQHTTVFLENHSY